MKVLHVIGAYPPTRFYTGPPQQVHALARGLRAEGVDVRVVTTNADGPGTTDVPTGRWVDREDVPVYYGRRIPGTGHLSLSAWRAIVREAERSDVIHVSGLFSWTDLAVASVARSAGVPAIVSPRGGLDPEALRFSSWKKALYFRAGGRRALQEAAGIHVTSDMERAHVEALFPGARFGVVPNGVAVPKAEDLVRWTASPPAAPTVVYLGRIHPKKNLLALVRAWASVAPRHAEAKLVLAGPDDHGHRAEVERAVAAERLGPSVVLPGSVSGDDKHALLARARCLVLPSLTENFGNVVAESLAHRVPVIASTGTPWAGLVDHDCGWWVEPSVEGLARALDDALSLSDEVRLAKGERGRRWMTEAFAWPAVAHGMSGFYDSVVSNRRHP